MNYQITQQFPNHFILAPQGTALSIYQTTHPTSPDNEQDPIRFKNLVKDAREQAETRGQLPEEAFECLEELSKNSGFWNYNTHGIAVFVDEEECQIFRLNTDVPNVSYVGEEFYLLPLLEYFDALDHAYVLSFDRSEFEILEGNQNGFKPVELDEEHITTFKELYPDLDADANLNVGSYGGRQASFHGHRARPEEVEKDKQKFFRHMDHVLSDVLSPHDPIILVGLPQHQALARKTIKNNNLLDEGIEKPLSSLDEADFLDKISKILSNAKQEHYDKLKARLQKGIQEAKYVTGADAVAKFIEEGRVDTLFISDNLMNGDLDPEQVEKVNDLTFAVLDKGGHFYVVPQEFIDKKAIFGALLRY